jgi:hypothetical protein
MLSKHKMFCGKNFIHTSAILYSNNNVNRIIEDSLIENSDRESTLQLVKYGGEAQNVDEDVLINLDITSIEESFPWLIDKNGNMIDLNKEVELFEGVDLISNFLEKKYNMDKNFISDVKLSELLNIFTENNNKSVTTSELFQRVSELYNKDTDRFKSNLIEKLSNNSDSEILNNLLADVNSNSSKPLGNLGDLTLNEIVSSLRDLKWNVLLHNTELTFHVLPMVMSGLSYGFMLNSFVKHVHKRPYPQDLTVEKLNKEILRRNKNLLLFAFLGAPLSIILFNKTGLMFSDMVTLKYNLSSPIESDTSNNLGLFLFLKNLNKKIPYGFKFLFSLTFVSLSIIKLLGYSIIEFFSDIHNIENFTIISALIAIIIQLTDLYFLHRISTKKMKISEVLPDFIINYLKGIEIASSSKVAIKEFKKECYIQICIYLVIIFLIII